MSISSERSVFETKEAGNLDWPLILKRGRHTILYLLLIMAWGYFRPYSRAEHELY